MNKRYKRLNHNKIDVPEYGLGSWMKKNAGTIGTVAGMAAGVGAIALTGGLAAPAVVPGMAAAAGGAGVLSGASGALAAGTIGSTLGGSVGGAIQKSEEQSTFDAEQSAQNEYNSKMQAFNAQQKPQSENIPTFRHGGMINYTGQSHEGPNGGIPVDDNGNPTVQSGNQPTGLTEDKEVAWKLPDGNTFIFSDSLGYAPVAKRIYSKYSKRLGKKMEKTDAISMKGLTQEFNDLAAEQEISKKMDGQKTGVKGTYRYGGTIDGEDGEESTKPTVSQPRSVSTKNISGIDMKFIPEPKPVKGKSGDTEMFIDDPSEWVSDKARKDAQGRYIASTIKKDYEQKFPEAVSKYKEFAAKNPGYSQEDLDAFIVMNKDIFNKAVLDKSYAKERFGKDLIPAYESMYNKKENTGSSEVGADPSSDMFGLRHYTQDSKPFTPYQEYVTSGAVSNISNPDALENYMRGYQIDNVEYTPEGYVYKVKQGKMPAGYKGFQGGTGAGEMFKNAKEVIYKDSSGTKKDDVSIPSFKRGGNLPKYRQGVDKLPQDDGNMWPFNKEHPLTNPGSYSSDFLGDSGNMDKIFPGFAYEKSRSIDNAPMNSVQSIQPRVNVNPSAINTSMYNRRPFMSDAVSSIGPSVRISPKGVDTSGYADPDLGKRVASIQPNIPVSPKKIDFNGVQNSASPEMYTGDNTMDYIGAGASMLGNTLQMLSNKKPGNLRLARVNPKTINLNNARTAMQDEARNTKVNLMRGLPSDVGYRANALKGIKDINQDVSKSILGSQTQEAMANAEIQNQAAAQNAEIQSQEALINAKRGEGYQNTQNAYKKAIMQAPIDALSRTSSRANMFDMAQLNENYDIVKNPKTGRIQFIPKKK